MTTIEERREWMRAGCPVEEITALHRCFTFVLNVWPDKGEIRATCENCGAIDARAGMGREGDMVSGVTPVVLAVCEWLDQHGKADAGTAAMVLADAVEFESWDTVRQWARSMMTGRHDGLKIECIPSESVGLYPRGRYLYRLSPVPMPKSDADGDVISESVVSKAARGLVASKVVMGPVWEPKFIYREPEDGEPEIAKKNGPRVWSSTYVGGSGSAGK